MEKALTVAIYISHLQGFDLRKITPFTDFEKFHQPIQESNLLPCGVFFLNFCFTFQYFSKSANLFWYYFKEQRLPPPVVFLILSKTVRFKFQIFVSVNYALKASQNLVFWCFQWVQISNICLKWFKLFPHKYFLLWFFSTSTKLRTSDESIALKKQELPPPPDPSKTDNYKNFDELCKRVVNVLCKVEFTVTLEN